jgi:hypothetical protein
MVGQRNAAEAWYIGQVAFVGKAPLLAVTVESSHSRWLEIWKPRDKLETVAAMELPGSPTCLSAVGNRIVAGCQSGDLISLCLFEKGDE